MLVSVMIHLSAELVRAVWRSFLRMARSLDRRLTAQAVRRELNAMPDFMLRDMGVSRSDLGYVARTLALSRGRFRR